MAKSKVGDLMVQLEESQATIAAAVQGLKDVLAVVQPQRYTGSTGEQIQVTLDSLVEIRTALEASVTPDGGE